MKKIELHLHLDGSLDIEYAKKLYGKDVYDQMVSNNDNSLAEYLEKFYLPGELLTEYNNIVEFSYRLAKQLEKEEVIYAEIRFCPTSHDMKISVDRVITGIREGLAKVPSVKTNLIFCMRRNYSFEENLRIIKLTKKYLGNGACAIDLVGDEASYKTENFKELFDIIKKGSKTGIKVSNHSIKPEEAALHASIGLKSKNANSKSIHII